jgi:FAD/FMN-containing dehydrogenase
MLLNGFFTWNPAANIRQNRSANKFLLRFCLKSINEGHRVPRKRSRWLSLLLLVASFLVTAKKVFEYAAAPNKDKESDFVLPHVASPEKPTIQIVEPKASSITLKQVGGFTNDASHLNKTAIYGIAKISSEEDIRTALQFAREHNLKISCAGQQHTMGGQTFTPGGLLLDLRDFNRIRLDKAHETVNIQSGARWWQLQRLLDKEGLSVKSMQSINIFSIGGSLSVNGHGIDPMPGKIAPTVRAMRIMLSDGQILEASPTKNAELFRHALGGYGLFGVILDVDFDIVDNEMYERRAVYMNYTEYPEYYRTKIEGNSAIGLVFARLSVSPKSYLCETAVHVYTRTKFDGSLPELTPGRYETVDRFIINFSKTGGTGRWLRWNLEKYAEPHLHSCITRNQAMNQPDACLVSRNQEMYDDMAYLRNRLRDTDILQEYFIPYGRMPEFVDSLREIVQRNKANLLNVTIRTVHKDTVTALPYAKQDMFGFVLYFNVGFNDRDNEILRKTTTNLIDASARSGGTYYLPYQLHYSKEQMLRSYPEANAFFATKKKYDPIGLFSSVFYEKYGM